MGICCVHENIYVIKALRDNYIYLLKFPQGWVAVDPGESEPLLRALKELEVDELAAVLLTHHHADHIGGVSVLKKTFPQLAIYAPQDERIPWVTCPLEPKEYEIFGKICIVLHVPGHTCSHVAFYFPDSCDLFSGDVIFACSCGNVFEGSLAEMRRSLQRIRELPPSTKIWAAHEYSLLLCQNAQRLLPPCLHELWQKRKISLQKSMACSNTTMPLLLADELQTNPYFQWDHIYWIETLKTNDYDVIFEHIAKLDS